MKDNFFKTLVRVEKIDSKNGIVWVCVPSWYYGCLLQMNISDFPSFALNEDFRFFAWVNIEVESPRDLIIKDLDFELE